MNVLSLFDGISCGRVALERASIKVDKYYSSEIDPYAIKIADKNYPDNIKIGDVTKVDGSQFKHIDLLIGGSPCQGFSFAGKQLNFNDERSALFFEYYRLLQEVKPKYFLLENVKMKKEYSDVITEYLGVEPVEINSSLVSAQNRKRLYWTNIPIVEQPKDKNINWGDVREYSVKQDNYYYSEKALNWIYNHGKRKNKILKVHGNNEKMQMIEASHYKKYSSQRFFGILDNGIDNSSQKKYLNNICNIDTIIPFQNYEEVLFNNFSYRYITPLECERLQTLPDNYTEGISNTQRYKCIGNGWTVDIIAHILKGVKNI